MTPKNIGIVMEKPNQCVTFAVEYIQTQNI